MSNFFHNYPYTDFHELNLDWIIEKIKELSIEWAATVAEWDETKTAFENLQNNFNDLKDYVDNYFDNLDVQDEINNKLDEMAADGTLINLIAPYLPFVTPDMFGAVGDGVTDDTAAFQTAINSNKKVVVPDGNYAISSIFLKTNTTLEGIGNRSVLTAIDPNADYVIDTDLNALYCTVKNIKINGSNICGCLRMKSDQTNANDTNHNLINIRCESGTIGIKLDRGNRADYIENVKIYYMSSDGINAEYTSDNKFVGCEIGACDENGYNFYNSSNNQMTTCKDFKCGRSGPTYYGLKCGSYMSISGHVSQGSYYSALYVDNYNVITGLTIFGCNFNDQTSTPTYFMDHVRINNIIEAHLVDGDYGNASYMMNPVQTYFLGNSIIITQDMHDRTGTPIGGSIPFTPDNNEFFNMNNFIIIGGIIRTALTKNYTATVSGSWSAADNSIKKYGNVVMLNVNLRYTGSEQIAAYTTITDVTLPQEVRPASQMALNTRCGPSSNNLNTTFITTAGNLISNVAISQNDYLTLRLTYII